MKTRYLILLLCILFTACQTDGDKKEATNFFLRGNAKFKEKEYYESIKWYTEAILKQSKFPDAYYNRGLVYQSLEKNEDALADFSKAVEQDAAFAPALFKKSEILQSMNRIDDALTSAQELVKKFPDSSANWSLQGNIQMQKSLWNESLASYDRALALDKNSVETMINQGVVYQELDQLDLAEKLFKKALTSGKFKDLIYNNLGYLEIRRMHWDLASQYVKKALDIDPKNPLYVKNWERIQQKSVLE
jgi:tetratricopeptide (TPR) repeat protein